MSIFVAIKQAAKELGIDLISDKPEGEYAALHIIIVDYYQLVLLGHIAGVNSACNSLKNPFMQAIDSLDRKVEDFKRKNESNDNQLG